MKNKIAGAVTTVTGLGIITRLLSFLFKIFISRTLGAEPVGKFQIALSVFFLFNSFSCSGLPLVLNRKVAERDALSRGSSGDIFTTTLCASMVISSLLIILLYTFSDAVGFLFSDASVIPLFMVTLPALLSSAVYCVIRGYLWGKKKFTAFSLTETAEESLRILLSILLLGSYFSFFDGTMALCIAFTVSDALATICIAFLFFRKKNLISEPAPLKEILLPSLPITGMHLASSLFGTLIAVLFPLCMAKRGLSGSEATATFGRISGMANPLLFAPCTITGSIAVVLMPDISALAVKKQYHLLCSRLTGGIGFCLVISGLAMALFLCGGTELTTFLFCDEESGRYLSFASLGILSETVAQMLQCVLNSIGKERKAFVSYITGNIITLLIILVGTKYLGIYSVSLATIVGNTIIMVLNSVMIRKITGWGKQTAKRFVSVFLFSLISALVAYTCKPYFASCDLLVQIILLFAICTICYGLLCCSAKFIDIKGFFAGNMIPAKNKKTTHL